MDFFGSPHVKRRARARGPAPWVSDRHLRRLDRQLAALSRAVPRLGPPLRIVRGRWGALLRFPLALGLIAGSVLAILPVFGLWMLPAGLILLAIDLPVLRPAVAAAIVRLRRRGAVMGRRLAGLRRAAS